MEKLGKTFKLNKNEFQWAFNSWSLIVKKRDKICQICNSEENLIAHHLFYKSKYPKLALNKNNGITLCKDCHYEVHGWFR